MLKKNSWFYKKREKIHQGNFKSRLKFGLHNRKKKYKKYFFFCLIQCY